ncbi:hypothetical protein D3C81_1907490 [compost metagenome]
MPSQQTRDKLTIPDVSLYEHVVRITVQTRQRLQVAGVGKRIQVNDTDALAHRLQHKIAADKAGTAGHKPSSHATILLAVANCSELIP